MRLPAGSRAAAAVFAFAFGATLLSAATNGPSFEPNLPERALWAQGRYVYQRNCLVCHGAKGDGQGEMGRSLKPPPRNFGRGVFKYRSTPTGYLPTNDDLEHTVRGGLAGTAMPVFGNLSDREIRSVVEYLKSFSPRWQNPTNYAPALVLPAPPQWFDDPAVGGTHVQRGRALFQAACAACHGTDGSGLDAAAKDLEDVWGQPVTITDLRQSTLRNGRSLDAIFRVLLTGIEGTPMPSFADSLTEEQRWELVAFIARLRRDHAAGK